jgi:hypothetical protein
VAPTFVGTIRGQVSTVDTSPHRDTARKGQDGKTYSLPKARALRAFVDGTLRDERVALRSREIEVLRSTVRYAFSSLGR